MPQCFVSTCGNYYGKTRAANSGIIYHMFPQSRSLALQWVEVCGGTKGCLPPTYTRVCSEHFSSACYQRDLQHELLGLPLRKRLKPGAVPDTSLPRRSVITTKEGKCEIESRELLSKCGVPMRSSVRIAKKRSVQELAKCQGLERTLEKEGNKLKFMANLKLRCATTGGGVNKVHLMPLSKYEFEYSLGKNDVSVCR